tara:strand:- start:16924 stop:17625 length:702 start_codon:yes stop_codon:yes gene_type:complete
MKEINEIVNNHISSLQSEGILQKAIEEGVGKAVMKAIEEQFNSWGGITKQLEAIFKEKLLIDASNLDLPTYNHVMGQAVKMRIEKHLTEEAGARMMASIEELLTPMPAEIKTHDFIEKICEYWKSDDPCSCYDDLDEYATVEVTENDGVLRDSYNLKIWKQRKEDSYLRSRDRSPDVHLYIIEGEIRLSHTFNPTRLREEESVIVKAYTAGTKLIDIDEYDPDDYEYELKGEY